MGKGVEKWGGSRGKCTGEGKCVKKYNDDDDDEERMEGRSEQEKKRKRSKESSTQQKEVEKWCTDTVLSFTSYSLSPLKF